MDIFTVHEKNDHELLYLQYMITCSNSVLNYICSRFKLHKQLAHFYVCNLNLNSLCERTCWAATLRKCMHGCIFEQNGAQYFA